LLSSVLTSLQNHQLKKKASSYWIRSAIFVFAQRISVVVFGFFNFVLVTRLLTQKQLGAWALFLVITGFFELSKTSLLKNAHIKFVSGNTDTKTHIQVASSSFLINSAITVLFIFFLLFFSFWLANVLHTGPDLQYALLWFIPGLIAMVFYAHLEAVQQSFLDFKGVFAGQFIRQLLFLLLLLFFYFQKKPVQVHELAFYQSLSILAGALVLFLYTKQHLHLKFHPKLAWIKKLSSYGGYIFGSSMLSNISVNLDQILTARYLPNSSVVVAHYSVAARICSFVDMPSYAASDILFPKLVQASDNEGASRLKYMYEKMMAILLSFYLPTGLVLVIFAKFAIHIIAGPAYVMAALILQLTIMNSFLGIFQNQAANTLNSSGMPFLCFKLNAVSFIFKVACSFIFIQAVGFYGAVIGGLVSSAAAGFFWYFAIKKQWDISIVSVFKQIPDVYKKLFQTVQNTITQKQTVSM
jgi:lipopolysaccharide exporter